MNSELSRRKWIQTSGLAGMTVLASEAAGAAGPVPARFENEDTPKICLEANSPQIQNGLPRADAGPDAPPVSEPAARRIKQLGVNYVLAGAGPIPWQENQLRKILDGYSKYGLTVGNIMIGGFDDAIYARPGRDLQIEKVIESVRAAGKAGLPVVEYNWYAHRAMEGYFAEPGRSGAGWTGFDDYNREVEKDGAKMRFRDLPPLENEGAHTADEMWRNITYFLKAVVPEAEKAGVRLALHPNDPPAPLSRGSERIMGSVPGWKKLIGIVDSPSNGITYNCGVTREMGEDPVAVAHYFGSRDRHQAGMHLKHTIWPQSKSAPGSALRKNCLHCEQRFTPSRARAPTKSTRSCSIRDTLSNNELSAKSCGPTWGSVFLISGCT